MPKTIELNFYEDDEGLALSGSVNFPNTVNTGLNNSLTVRGLAEWRHVPANIIHVNEYMIETFNMTSKSQALSKAGLNWIGLKADSEILISYSIRKGRTGTAKVTEQLKKFFKVLGASSVSIDVEEDG